MITFAYVLHKFSALCIRMCMCVIVIAASPKSVGWEKNAKNKLIPRKVDLSSSMDPVKYAHVYCY